VPHEAKQPGAAIEALGGEGPGRFSVFVAWPLAAPSLRPLSHPGALAPGGRSTLAQIATANEGEFHLFIWLLSQVLPAFCRVAACGDWLHQ